MLNHFCPLVDETIILAIPGIPNITSFAHSIAKYIWLHLVAHYFLEKLDWRGYRCKVAIPYNTNLLQRCRARTFQLIIEDYFLHHSINKSSMFRKFRSAQVSFYVDNIKLYN